MDESKYILVCAYGGLIHSLQVFEDKEQAVSTAETLWKLSDPEADDIKVFSDKGFPQWVPPEAE